MTSDELRGYLYAHGSTWAPYKELREAGIQTDVLPPDVISYNGYYTLSSIADAEDAVAQDILRLSLCANEKPKIPAATIESYIADFEASENNGRVLDVKQKEAVKMVLENLFSVLTGGPGTGKTTVLSAIQYCLKRNDPDALIEFTAPTGKAARRIRESTGAEAHTVHKKLGIGYGYSAKTVFDDVLFVDESSMLDIFTSRHLFRAIKTGRRVCIVGDVEQLPSVGLGSVLRDIINSRVIPVTILTKTFRQDNTSTLFYNIQQIKEGKSELREGSDFHCLEVREDTDKNDIAKFLRDVYVHEVNTFSLDETVLLVPYRESANTISSRTMNPFIQRAVNKKNNAFKHGNDTYMQGDLVMQLENRDECANGDVGKVTEVCNTGIKVSFAEGDVFYEPSDMNQITLAYATTIHKAQGSEYPAVIVCILNDHSNMLNRNLIYTAITRAKKECYLIYQKEALETAVARKADSERFSMLADKLKLVRYKYMANQ